MLANRYAIAIRCTPGAWRYFPKSNFHCTLAVNVPLLSLRLTGLLARKGETALFERMAELA
jgi:hypothetical protein